MQNKKVLLAPLMGAMISVFIFVIYLISIADYKTHSISNIVFSLFNSVPVMVILFIIISYVIAAVIGIPLIFIKNKYLLSPKFFWFLAWIIFSITGLLAAILNFKVEANIAKALAICLSFTFGGLFSASLYTVLNDEVKNN